jgi:hypothetical protein
VKIPAMGILELPLGSPGTKWHLGANRVASRKVYYKREGGGFPKSGLWWVLWVWVCLWLILALKVLLIPYWNSSMPLYP